jgi:prevent-host-death family protein
MNVHAKSKLSNYVSLYDAKTSLSSLVEAAADGQEIIITKNGKPRAKLVAVVEDQLRPRRVMGRNELGITHIADDAFDADPLDARLWGMID